MVNRESVIMVNRYIFVVVNRESAVMVNRYIFGMVNREPVGNGESLHIRRGQRHPKKTTKDQTTTIRKDHQRPDDQKTPGGLFYVF